MSGPEERPSAAPFRVWVVDAREETRSWLGASLAEAGHAVEWAGTPSELGSLAGAAPDVIVLGGRA